MCDTRKRRITMVGVFTVAVILQVIQQTFSHHCEGHSCFTFFVPKENIHQSYRLADHVIKTLPYKGKAIACIEACAVDCKCVSINIRTDVGRCELSSEDEKSLIQDDFSTFLNISVENHKKDKSAPCEVLCCHPNPCQNGGKCSDLCFHSSRRFECMCKEGFTGRFCESEINECSSNPCQNGGTCVDEINSYMCECVAGYTGQDCETNIDECFANPCQNNGTCVDEVNSYTCQCVAGYTGQDCETNIDDCSQNLCINGTCVDGLNNYTCTCFSGYTGQYCEIEIVECAEKPCLHGRCTDGLNSYTCLCYPGYTGANCTSEINECESRPCENGGTCEDLIDGYHCRCRHLWIGSRCETYTTTCSVLRSFGQTASSSYSIDPDGEGNEPPFNAYCDMNDKQSIGVTVVTHDSTQRTLADGCEDPGCYRKDIHYTGATIAQLAALATVSQHCEQFIKYECYDSQLLYQGYGWWVSRDGARMNYWGGAAKGSGKCACGMTKSCEDYSLGCNCDANKWSWRSDEGFLTDKDSLPVSQLRFGDLKFNEEGYHTLGDFKCFG